MSEFGGSGFQVLGFPSDVFNLQEPAGTAEELLNGIKYVRPGGGFVPNFQMFQKTDVNGDKEHPVYTFLKSLCGPTADAFEDRLFYSPLRVSDVRWNFEIFVVTKSGQVVYRYSPDHDLSKIRDDIRHLIINESGNESGKTPLNKGNVAAHELREELSNEIIPF